MGNRIFLAVRPPEEVVETLAGYVEPRSEASTDLRWIRPENWHLTLVFLGDVREDRLDELATNAAAVAASTDPFDLVVGGAGAYPHPNAAKVVWTGVRAGGEALAHLAGRCRTAASRAGIRVEGRGFDPHLTLARSSRGAAVRRWLQVIDSFPDLSWRVEEFLLVDSELNRGGSRYTTRQRFALTGRGADPAASDEKMPQ